MASRSRRIQNNAGSANSFLDAVAEPKAADSKIAKAGALAGKNEKLVNAVLSAVKQCIDDSDKYQKKLDSKSIDVTLGRIASLLDEVKTSFVEDELASMKQDILNEISGLTTSGVLKSFLLIQISSLFDNSATKEDIEELKQWLSDNISLSSNGSSVSTSDEEVELGTSGEDNEEGDYQDSTLAKNFSTLRSAIDKQFDQLNKNLKTMPGGSGVFSKLSGAIGVGFSGVFKGMAKLTKGVASTISKTTSIAKSFGKFTLGGISLALSWITKGIGSVVKGIGSLGKGIGGLGKKIGGAIASPFKKIGGVFSSLNPFKRSEQKKEDKKQRAKDKMMAVMSNVVGKIWKVVEPIVGKLALFMGIITKFVIIPIALIALKVLLIVGIVTALIVGVVLIAIWVKNKIVKFWNWLKDKAKSLWARLKKLWTTVKLKFIAFVNWIKALPSYLMQKVIEIGKTLLNAAVGIIISYIKTVFINIPIMIWKKLCEFGKWLYDTYIDPYIVQPFKKYIWEPLKKLWNETVWPMIEPFVKSLTELKNKIVQAFSAWDTNKSIWENLKNIGGIIKNAVAEWWEGSPFKQFWDNKVWPMLEPFITSLTELKDNIVQAFSAWDVNQSIWDNLKNIGGIIISSVSEWYENSPFKKVIDNYVVAPLKMLRQKITELLLKLSSFSIKLPVGIDITRHYIWKWDIPIPSGIKWDTVKPFGSLASALGNAETVIPTPPNTSQIQEAATSQVQNAIQPIRQLEQMKSTEGAELLKSGEEVSNIFEQKDKEQQQFNQDQSNALNAIRTELGIFKSEALKKLDDPAAIPVPVPVNTQHNSATMRSN